MKYLGLYALCKLLPLRPLAVTEHRDVILECLNDRDVSIRMRALELISGMVTKRNVIDILRRLMQQIFPTPSSDQQSTDDSSTPPKAQTLNFIASENNYVMEMVNKILGFCSKDTYELVTDFEWYIGVLAKLARVPRISVGKEISKQLIDVAVRVKEVRQYAVQQMVSPSSFFFFSLHFILVKGVRGSY